MRLRGQVAVQELHEAHEEMRLGDSGAMPGKTQKRHDAVSFRQNLSERPEQYSEVTFRFSGQQKNGSPSGGPFFCCCFLKESGNYQNIHKQRFLGGSGFGRTSWCGFGIGFGLPG